MTDQEKIEWFDRAVKFQIEDLIFLVMKSRKSGKASWAIEDIKTHKVLNSNMEWEEEPPVAQRDEAFMIRARFDFETAMVMFEQYKMFSQ